MHPTDGDDAVTDKLSKLLAFCSFFITQPVIAEIVYVTDVLQLALHDKENSSGQLLRNLASGTRLEILERKNYYVKVKTSDGLEGWTKRAFLVKEKPARLRLDEVEQQNKTLLTKLGNIREELSVYEEQLLAQISKSKEAAHVAETSSTLAARLERENQECLARVSVQANSIPLNWALAGVLGSLFLGLIAGIAFFDYRSRRRHGGFRVYLHHSGDAARTALRAARLSQRLRREKDACQSGSLGVKFPWPRTWQRVMMR